MTTEQEQAEKIRALEGKLALVMGELDAAEAKAAHLEARLKVAHESITTTNDKMAELVRQARLELLEDVMGRAPAVANSVERLSRFWEWLNKAHDANAPKD